LTVSSTKRHSPNKTVSTCCNWPYHT